VKSETFPDHPFGLADSFGLADPFALADSFGLAPNPFGLSLSKPCARNN